MSEGTRSDRWWANAVFYQVYPRSFSDGNGDGTGDLIGVRERMPYLRELGVDALWLSPFFTSPMADGGYDVADPCDVDPMFGTLADFDAMLAEAHAQGLKVTVDVVPNHFSEQHPWFQAALAARPGSPERARFHFRPGRGEYGERPPNNWPSVFGGRAWRRLPAGGLDGGGLDGGGLDGGRLDGGGLDGGGLSRDEWYLHLFAPEQPDLNWDNPEVPAEFERVLRFWLDRGVDGFRIDVAHGMAKPAGLPDVDLSVVPSPESGTGMPSLRDIRWDRDEVHDIHRSFRRVLDSYPGDRMAVGEAWVADSDRLARYVRPDELNLTFNFELIEASWGAETFGKAIERSLDAMSRVGAPCTWVLANHDVARAATRYGGGPRGRRRALAAALIQLSLPGAAYIYNGDELGLENVELPDEALQDPTWERSRHTERGRDGERVPMPWSGSEPPYGFTSGTSTWLPMPAGWADRTVATQRRDPGSELRLYQRALRLRRHLAGAGFEWIDAAPGCLSYRRGPVTVVLNAGDEPIRLPEGQVLLASAAVDGASLPPDTTVWLQS